MGAIAGVAAGCECGRVRGARWGEEKICPGSKQALIPCYEP
jgi:hypothetical protein